jgi:hypothetical protein
LLTLAVVLCRNPSKSSSRGSCGTCTTTRIAAAAVAAAVAAAAALPPDDLEHCSFILGMFMLLLLLQQLLMCCQAIAARCNGESNVLNDRLLGTCVSCRALKLMSVVALSASAAASLLQGSGCSSRTVPAEAAATRCSRPWATARRESWAECTDTGRASMQARCWRMAVNATTKTHTAKCTSVARLLRQGLL